MRRFLLFLKESAKVYDPLEYILIDNIQPEVIRLDYQNNAICGRSLRTKTISNAEKLTYT